jgi:alpha-tubulin suppressor-like RCC1 family protein
MKHSSADSGHLFSFGKADHGKLGHGDASNHRVIPTFVEHFRGIKIAQVASMSTYSLAVDFKGVPYIWGTGGSPSYFHGHRTDILPMVLESIPVQLPVTQLSCGLGHALFLMSGGKVYAWGNGGNGRLGTGSTQDRPEAAQVLDLDGFVVTSVCCGASHSLVITQNGRLFAWGKNAQGQCGRNGGEDVLRPIMNTTIKDELIQVSI